MYLCNIHNYCKMFVILSYLILSYLILIKIIMQYLTSNIPSPIIRNSRHNHKYIYIVVVSVIGVGNRSTRRKPPTFRKSQTNFIT